jgi:hypothetical protein
MSGNTISLQLLVIVNALHTFYFAYSGFSVFDELCMHMYINIRIYHRILLSIQVDDEKCVVMNPLDKERQLYESIALTLGR